MLHMPSPLWHSESIELFVLGDEDVTPQYVAWLNDPLVNRFLESRFQQQTLESTRVFVERCRQSEDDLLLGIRTKGIGSRHVGNIKLGPINHSHGLGEVGILIGDRGAWSKGVATEAILILSRVARTELSLRKLIAGCYASNIGSQMAFLHAGFEVEAVRRAHLMLDDEPHDVVLMARWLS